jgi:hypothetical protein
MPLRKSQKVAHGPAFASNLTSLVISLLVALILIRALVSGVVTNKQLLVLVSDDDTG